MKDIGQLTVDRVKLIGETRHVESIDNVTRRHCDADERWRRHECLPAWKRVGDGKHAVRRPEDIQRLLGAQPVDHGRSYEQAGRDERRVQYADACRAETVVCVDGALKSLETAVADVD